MLERRVAGLFAAPSLPPSHSIIASSYVYEDGFDNDFENYFYDCYVDAYCKALTKGVPGSYKEGKRDG